MIKPPPWLEVYLNGPTDKPVVLPPAPFPPKPKPKRTKRDTDAEPVSLYADDCTGIDLDDYPEPHPLAPCRCSKCQLVFRTPWECELHILLRHRGKAEQLSADPVMEQVPETDWSSQTDAVNAVSDFSFQIDFGEDDSDRH